MDQRQLEKERIRLTREIAMLESQLSSAIRGKEEKLEENKTIREEIARLEEENKALEEETRKLDDEISKLDEEFKQAQLDAGRLRREIKINNERAESEVKKSDGLKKQLLGLQNNLEILRREIKSEIDERRNLEARLRKTNSHIDSMKEHKLSRVVTSKLEKLDWYQRSDDYELADYSDDGDGVSEEMSAVAEEPATEPSESTDEAAVKVKKDNGDSDGIDFSIG
jgi:chromosome segregation ATPase